METPITDTVESYREAEMRLRHVLLGDGVDMPGLVKGEDLRSRVNRDLRRMRDASARLSLPTSARICSKPRSASLDWKRSCGRSFPLVRELGR